VPITIKPIAACLLFGAAAFAAASRRAHKVIKDAHIEVQQ